MRRSVLRLHPSATGKNGGKHNKYVCYIVDCYWNVWNVVMRRSVLRLHPTATGKNGGKHNKYIRYIIDCYWIV